MNRKVRGRLPNVSIICRYLLGGTEKIRESPRSYSRPGRLSHRASIEYKAEEASYLHHFSAVNELLRFVYLNICGVSVLSEQNEVFLIRPALTCTRHNLQLKSETVASKASVPQATITYS